MQIIFLYSPKYVNKFLVWHKKFEPAQNIFGPVKGQGIRIQIGKKILGFRNIQEKLKKKVFPTVHDRRR